MTYLAYAGIGSRKTPQHILTIMHDIGAYLCGQGWTLRSGGAPGADSAFEQGVYDFTPPHARLIGPYKEIYLPWHGFNNSMSTLHPQNYPFSDQETNLAAQCHPHWDRCSPAARKLHARNVRQILGLEAIHGPEVVPVKFVICWTQDGNMRGGTSQALRIAEACQIEIINLGSAQNENELETLVLRINELQEQFKEAT